MDDAARSRQATQLDFDDIVATLTAAFAGDPLWRWAFPRLDDLAVLWRLLVGSALRYPWVRILDGAAAAAIWIPPGGTELTDDEERTLPALLQRLLGARAADVLELMERFAAAHPDAPPHYYLSLLGTRPDQRGRGAGMALLADSLALIDAERMPAYLESSNPANDVRYERLGFVRTGSFTTPDGAHTVATMWREPPIG